MKYLLVGCKSTSGILIKTKLLLLELQLMTTSPAGTTEFPFDDINRLIDEEQELPPIPDFPSIWTKKKSDDE